MKKTPLPITLPFLSNVAACLTENAKLEHRAIMAYNRTVAEAAQVFKDYLGYKHVLYTGTVYFLKNWTSGDQIEIIPGDDQKFVEHEAFAVPTAAEFDILYENFYSAKDKFEYREGSTLGEELRLALFTHEAPGRVVQLIWRKTQIFEGFFTPNPA